MFNTKKVVYVCFLIAFMFVIIGSLHQGPLPSDKLTPRPFRHCQHIFIRIYNFNKFLKYRQLRKSLIDILFMFECLSILKSANAKSIQRSSWKKNEINADELYQFIEKEKGKFLGLSIILTNLLQNIRFIS